MAITLDRVVPFGRSLDEYWDMFTLSGEDLECRLLGVGDGPASFNAELSRAGGRVVSVDPLYRLSIGVIQTRFEEAVDNIIDQVRATPDDWSWNWHASPDALRQTRVRAMERFADDYPCGRNAGRYVTGELPILPFADDRFDLALCSHLLFLYADIITEEFHYLSLLEMLRVAREVRVFPLLTLERETPPALERILHQLGRDGFEVAVQCSDYELQRGGNEMLVVRRNGGPAS